ncbi:RNA polymerase II elongation factor ELL [Aplysia californica]|uniref:RNA polymerase II elongation factor ELL n=1 Tax=Aplysia californica TaxID=6500 RepID=A0ABM0JA10_APLCA|nr:RNA polymerase II elongation factor ELL [Aplysia californica]
MATLLEGQEYGLASNELLGSNKTVIHFKLTDSCLKTLEELSKRGQGVLPSIQFQGNQGVIRIPSHVASAGRQPERTYQVSLSALPGDLNGSFDCIQQTSRHGTSHLHSLGSMHHRVAVHATDDVYDRTRAKMTMAEEENKKVCTKEIKPSGRHISKRVKKVLSPGSLKIPPATKPSIISKPAPSSVLSAAGRHGSGLASSSALSLSSSSSNSTSVMSQRMSNSPLSLSSSQAQSKSLSSSKLSSASNSSRVLTSSTTKQSSGAINMPYRDRVIHLLALKSYKKPELILKLQKDGIREKDKNSLGSVLQQVATLNKDNSYTLARAAWVDVRQDWPFFTDQDRALLKKNLQESRTTPTSPAVSPASSNPESPGSSQKRVIEEPEEVSANKKKRIAHGERRQNEERPVSVVKPTLNQQSSPTANRENVEGTVEDSSCDKPEFISKYLAIKNTEQRQQYKHEFNREYSEYHQLHREVDSVARKFLNLRSQIDQTEEGSPDFEVLKKQVLEEYEAQKSDPKFMAKKQRMEYLHQKLGHIKRLIHDYDHRGQVLTKAS